MAAANDQNPVNVIPPAGAGYSLTSVSDESRYGLYLEAASGPDCARMQFLVQDAGHNRLGQSGPLAPGESTVVRMGRSFAPGDHALIIVSIGCLEPPAEVRRVRLSKNSPDHGWLWR